MKTATPLALLAALACAAHGQSFTATLTPAQDGGGTRQGSGLVDLSLSGTTLTLSGNYSGLSANSSAGHIHGPAPVGTSTGVLYDLGGAGILTLGTTAGTFSGSFSLTPLNSGAYTVAQQLSDLESDQWYINIHDSVFPGGEIRGQVILVPEPSSLALLVLGSLAVAGRVWIRRPALFRFRRL